MKKITIIAYSAFLLIMLINLVFYNSLYKNQIEYSVKLLDRQARIVGSDIDNTSMYFVSDLTEINFSDDISLFFSDDQVRERAKGKIKLYYSRYEDIIVGLMLYNNAGDVYTLFKDEERNSWLDGSYRAQSLPRIYTTETLENERDKYKYYLPVIKDGQVLGNFVVTIDFERYFSTVFTKYNLGQNQWQWVVNDSGMVVFDNFAGESEYSELRKIIEDLDEGVSGRVVHSIRTGGTSNEIISAYYPINIIGLDFGIVFSAPTDFFQKSIIRNAVIMGVVTILLILFIINLFRSHFSRQRRQLSEAKDSEITLISIIDQMPVGIIVYNKNREILRANRQAALLFSYEEEEKMKGMLVPDLSRNSYVSDFTGQFGQGKIIRLSGTNGDRIVFRNDIPVAFKGEEATLEVFIDVTTLESARRQEADANVAKSELLARMSFEIRTPLNGIVGMTEMLSRSDLPEESKEIARLLRHSADLLITIVNDIFDVSKVEIGKMILDEIPFRLREEVAYCINLVKRENPDTFVRFESEIDPGVPENLIGDPYRLRQIITNLLYNSLSGTQTGHISIGCRVNEANGNQFSLLFSIIDSGKIYSRAEIKKLFGDYITNLSGRSEWAEDLKLGPVLARQLTELMGGELIAESPAFKDDSGQEKGLRVTFSINVHLNEKISKKIDLTHYTTLSSIKTLAITGSQGRDDDFLGIMHRLGLPVSVTSFQKHTISQIRTNLHNSPDKYILLILLDEPDTDGFEAGKALLDEGLTGEFIILMFTSKDPKGHYARCVDMGIDHLLVKPFASEDLLNILKDHFPYLKTATDNTAGIKASSPVILVVDDNFLNRKVVGSLLKVLGVKAEYATGGAEAIAMTREKQYDFVLMDLIMPEVDGFEAARAILDFDKDTIIVALSADTLPETHEKAKQTGMKDVLVKPAAVDDLRRVLEKYVKLK
ncbi:MAG: response regulator [Bacteroidales bacterium]|nr:response regulator [Bacteroidales bacterium]